MSIIDLIKTDYWFFGFSLGVIVAFLPSLLGKVITYALKLFK